MRALRADEQTKMRKMENLKFCADCTRCQADEKEFKTPIAQGVSVQYYCLPDIVLEPSQAWNTIGLAVNHRNVAWSMNGGKKICESGHTRIEERQDCDKAHERLAEATRS